MKKIRKAIIPAAGFGTRFLPATKAMPKEMMPIVDKPAIQYIVEEAIQSGIEDILIITGRNKRAIEDHFDRSVELEASLTERHKDKLLKTVQDISNMAEIYYIRQKDVLGLGNAVYCARKFIGNEPFAILLGDDIVDSRQPCLKQLMEVYDNYQQPVIGVQPVEGKDTSQYGIISYEKTLSPVMKVNDLVEKPPVDPPSNMAIMGRYILPPDIFDYLAVTEPGLGGEIQLTDALRALAGSGELLAYNFEGKRYDIGSKLGFLKATINFSLQRKDIQAELKDYLDSIMQTSVR